jgi:hypothetical protein
MAFWRTKLCIVRQRHEGESQVQRFFVIFKFSWVELGLLIRGPQKMCGANRRYRRRAALEGFVVTP